MADSYATGTVVPFLHPTEEVFEIFKGLSRDPEDSYPDSVRALIPEDWTDADDDEENFLTEEMQQAFQALGWEFSEGDKEKGVYLFCEDGGTPDEVVDIVQWFLAHDTEDTPWATFEIAFTCSKTRPGQFGGGAWFITKDSAEASGTAVWLHQKAEEWKAVQKEGPRPTC
jgi:hypothetical protein